MARKAPNQLLIFNYAGNLALRKRFVERNLKKFEQKIEKWPQIQGKKEWKFERKVFKLQTCFGANELNNEQIGI